MLEKRWSIVPDKSMLSCEMSDFIRLVKDWISINAQDKNSKKF